MLMALKKRRIGQEAVLGTLILVVSVCRWVCSGLAKGPLLRSLGYRARSYLFSALAKFC